MAEYTRRNTLVEYAEKRMWNQYFVDIRNMEYQRCQPVLKYMSERCFENE